ncbi:hypothetical protein [Mesorhizobium sp. RIZ17]|uniref:hypothetical protein n=1 Tax=Mesorhizobium TaxID=68287 RepID=UPI003DA9718D
MPGLGETIDSDDLEHRYLGKVIIFVEAPGDAAVLGMLIGPGYDERIEFKSFAEAKGSVATKDRVKEERQSNKKIFALLDGEAAVMEMGGFARLLYCDTFIFSLGDPNLEGVLFLAEHELENIILRQANVCHYIINDETLMGVGAKSRDDVAAAITNTIERQFAAAVCKYASIHLNREGKMAGAFKKAVWDDPTPSTMKTVKVRVVNAHKAHWPTFYAEVRELKAAIKERFEPLDNDRRSDEMARLADGKTALSWLAHSYKIDKKWLGHLMEQVTAMPYADRLREEIFEATGA